MSNSSELPGYDPHFIHLPNYALTWQELAGRRGELPAGSIVTENAKSRLSILTEYVKPHPRSFETGGGFVVVFGNPVIDGRIDCDASATYVWKNLSDCRALSLIDGEFLFVVFDKVGDEVTVVNDRYASIPFFFFHDRGLLYASNSYLLVCEELRLRSQLTIDQTALFELLWFRRLHGTRTHDNRSVCLPAARRLTCRVEGYQLDQYWEPNYEKAKYRSLGDASAALSEAVGSSLKRKTTDGKRYGLFLSGGLDTRTVLAAFDPPPHCFTVGYTDQSREVQRAQDLARIVDAPHTFLGIPDDHFSRVFDHARKQASGMYAIGSFFLGFENHLSSNVDAAFCGVGFDYMFQGMYIPANPLKIGSKQFKWRRRAGISDDLISQYVNTVSYRLKFPRTMDFVKSEWRQSLRESLVDNLEALIREGRNYSDDPYDLWDFLLFHSLSRHYSYPDLLGLQSNVELRTPSFDNELYQVYLSMPLDYRFDARALRGALRNLNPKFLQVRSANDDLPIASSQWRTAHQLILIAQKRMQRITKPAMHLQRTFPSSEQILRTEPKFTKLCRNLGRSDGLAMIGWLDRDKVNRAAVDWLDHPNKQFTYRMDDFFWHLISLNEFLEQSVG